MIKKIEFERWYVLGKEEKAISGTLEFKNNKIIIIGDNGLGKTSFMNTIFGVLTNDSTFYNYVRFAKFRITLFDDNTIELVNDNMIKSVQHAVETIKNTKWSFKESHAIEFEQCKNQFPTLFRELDINFDKEGTSLAHDLQSKINQNDTHEIWKIHNITTRYRNSEMFLKQKVKIILSDLLSLVNEANSFLQNSNNDVNSELTKRFIKDKTISYITVFRNAKDYIQHNTSRSSSILVNYELQKSGISMVMHAISSDVNKMISEMKKDFFDNITQSTHSEHPLSSDEIDSIQEIGKLISDDAFIKVASKLRSDNNFNVMSANNFRVLLQKFQEKSEGKLQKINLWVENINNFLNDKEIILDKDGFNVKTNSNKEIFNPSLFSAGEKNMMRLLQEIIIAEPKILIIDEPELSLSIKWQVMIAELINNSRKTQFILTTHSPYIINDSDAEFLQRIDQWKE